MSYSRKTTTSIRIREGTLNAAKALAKADDRDFSGWLDRQLVAIVRLHELGVDLGDVARHWEVEREVEDRVAEDLETD